MSVEYLTQMDGCGCCQSDSGGGQVSFGCADKRRIFTQRELDVLERIREAGEKARSLKREIVQLRGTPDFRAEQAALEELGRLRAVRSELEEERIAAAEERMRFLGHA